MGKRMGGALIYFHSWTTCLSPNLTNVKHNDNLRARHSFIRSPFVDGLLPRSSFGDSLSIT